jgi:mono/diheme cytochrome c family protein
MKTFLLSGLLGLFLISCGNNNENALLTDEEATEAMHVDPNYDPIRGSGKYTAVELKTLINEEMAEAGRSIYQAKCMSCHTLTEQKMAAPGWKNMTKRHSPEWIMNFLSNTDEMLDKDPELQAQLEVFKVRMPDQNLNDEEARAVLEFMRKNDGPK